MRPILVMVLLAAMLPGCSGGSSSTPASKVTPQQQAGASASMGLTFPPETRFLFYHRASEESQRLPAPDDAVHLKIELPASALPGFLAQAPLSAAQWKSTHSLTDAPDWPHWRPSQIRKFRFEQFQLPKGDALNVLLDDDSDDTKVVYLFWFET